MASDNDIVLGDNAAAQLRSYISRIENLEHEKADIAADIKELYADAKAMGFDTKTIRAVIRERKGDRNKRDNERALFDLYWGAVGEYTAMEDGA